MRRRWTGLALAAVLLAASAWGSAAAAQTATTATETRAAQFVFVVDDSGSMATTDPNRLAVFAVRSLLGMLDDRDEVSVVRLNGARDGEPPPPIEPLARNRSSMEALLSLRGSIADYGARLTPCTSSLQAVHRLLEDSYRPEAAQVVFFLTDGACEPDDFHRPQADAFLDGLSSFRDGQLQLYLLRFRGRQYTRELADLAERTGGQAIEVGTSDPTAILHPFAQALSHSQGYDSALLSPGDDRLPAHRGAERVRLLAVARGRGPALAVTIRDAHGESPRLLGQPRTGTHQYGGGEVFRFAALDYRPGSAPVRVDVQGAGGGWQVVALPEYRLTLGLDLLRGPCAHPGEPVGFAADTGTTVCAVAELRNARGEVVGGALSSGDLVAKIEVRDPEHPDAAPVELVGNPMGDRARFGVQRSNLPSGQYEFTPKVTLRLSSGDTVELRGRPYALEVSSIQIAAEPAELDLGTLAPVGGTLREVRFSGAFPPEPGHLEIRDRANVPSCISFSLSGIAEGEAQPIHVDHRYELAARVAPYCGPHPIERSIETVARLIFDPREGQRALPSVEIPLRLALDYRITPPADLTLHVRGGASADLPVPIRGNFQDRAQLVAVLAGPDESAAWPDDADDLELGFAGREAGRLALDDTGEVAFEQPVTVGPGGGGANVGLTLRVRADGCCSGGSYRTELGLVGGGGEYADGAPLPEALRLPVTVVVEPAGLWACWGSWILWGLAILLVLLLLAYLAGMVRHSRFLNRDRLAGKLVPLVWSSAGGTVEEPRARDDVRALVHRDLRLPGRALAWLKANPFKFGLPGRSYDETVELSLRPHRDAAASRLRLEPRAEMADEIRRNPGDYRGRLFAAARAGITVLGVPDQRGRFSQMHRDGAYAPLPAEGDEPRAESLKRTTLLREVDERDEIHEGDPAGWRVG